ncbi:hypothetical protein VTI74DRAFT_6304 [Chaetomium olivicolor]
MGTVFTVLESTTPDPARALQFNVVGQPWDLISAALSKISIFLFFISLLRRARHWRVLLTGLIIVVAVIDLAFALATYLQCRPLESVWNPSVDGTCSNPNIQANLGYTQGAFSVFSSVFLSLFPALIVRDISRSGEPTWSFYSTSALNLVCGIFVIVRTAQTSRTTGLGTYTIHFFYASLMANLDQNLSLISSNTLSLSPLFSRTALSASSSSFFRRQTHHHNGRKPRRDPYSSASSSSTSRSRRSAGKSGRALGSAGGRKDGLPCRTGSSRSIARPDTPRSVSQTSFRHHHDAVDQEDTARGMTTTMMQEGSEIDRRRTTHLIIERPRVVRDHIAGDNGNDDDEDGGGGGDDDDLEKGRVPVLAEDGWDLGDGRLDGGGRCWENRNGQEDSGPRGYGRQSSDGYESEEEKVGRGEEEGIELGAWPRGIIKTVTVEIVEEVNEEWVAAQARGHSRGDDSGAATVMGTGGSKRGVGRNSVMIMPGGAIGTGVRQMRIGVHNEADRVSGGSGVEQDWETMLRTGPPR